MWIIWIDTFCIPFAMTENLEKKEYRYAIIFLTNFTVFICHVYLQRVQIPMCHSLNSFQSHRQAQILLEQESHLDSLLQIIMNIQ